MPVSSAAAVAAVGPAAVAAVATVAVGPAVAVVGRAVAAEEDGNWVEEAAAAVGLAAVVVAVGPAAAVVDVSSFLRVPYRKGAESITERCLSAIWLKEIFFKVQNLRAFE